MCTTHYQSLWRLVWQISNHGHGFIGSKSIYKNEIAKVLYVLFHLCWWKFLFDCFILIDKKEGFQKTPFMINGFVHQWYLFYVTTSCSDSKWYQFLKYLTKTDQYRMSEKSYNISFLVLDLINGNEWSYQDLWVCDSIVAKD